MTRSSCVPIATMARWPPQALPSRQIQLLPTSWGPRPVSHLWWDCGVVSSCSLMTRDSRIMREGTLDVWLRHHFPDHAFSLSAPRAPVSLGCSSTGDSGYLIPAVDKLAGRLIMPVGVDCITLISGRGRGSCRHHPVLPFPALVLAVLLLYSCSQFMCNDLGPS